MSNLHGAQVTGNQTITTTTETVVATLPALTYNNPGGIGVQLTGQLNITTGTGTTAVVTRFRQGTGITGTLVGNAITQAVTAGNAVEISIEEIDTTTLTGTVGYVMTVQQTGATANGTVSFAEIAGQAATNVE